MIRVQHFVLAEGLPRNTVDERSLKGLGAVFEGNWESGKVSEMSISIIGFL